MNPLIKFHKLCLGSIVQIVGPLMDDIEIPIVYGKAIAIRMNKLTYKQRRCDIWIDNGSGENPEFNSPSLTFRAGHAHRGNSEEVLFLSGPMSEDQLTFAPPHLFADNAWHKSIWFSPLAGVVALEKVRHTGARKIYMLGMDLYQGKQSLAYAHNLVDNARYIAEIARNDSRVVLCEALENSIRGILL